MPFHENTRRTPGDALAFLSLFLEKKILKLVRELPCHIGKVIKSCPEMTKYHIPKEK
jgi:hypothetical protein